MGHTQRYPRKLDGKQLTRLIGLRSCQPVDRGEDRGGKGIGWLARWRSGPRSARGSDLIQPWPGAAEVRLGHIELLVGDVLEDQCRIKAEYAVLKVGSSNRRRFIAAEAREIVASSVRAFVAVPLAFSLRITSQLAAFSASIWTARSWPVVLTRAYPIAVMANPLKCILWVGTMLRCVSKS
jgi:hypothetical protein